MPSEQLWKAATGSTIIAADGALKNLANNGIAVSSEVTNGTSLKTHANFELYIHDYAAAPTANSAFELHIVYQLDGTNYADGEDGDVADPNLSGNTLHGCFIVPVAVDEDMRMQLLDVPVLPFDFKVCIVNKSGQAIPNTDNSTLKIWLFSKEAQ
jgi:hypothetical protein